MSTLRTQLFTIVEPAIFNNTDSSYLDTALDNLEGFVRDQCKQPFPANPDNGQDFLALQAVKKKQLQPAAEQALEQLKPILEAQQDFGWLDDVIELYDAFFTDGGKKAFVAAIQAHFTAQAKQHQVDLLRARIEEIEYPASVRAYKAGLGVSEYESFLTKDEQSRRNRLQAELDKLESTNGNA